MTSVVVAAVQAPLTTATSGTRPCGRWRSRVGVSWSARTSTSRGRTSSPRWWTSRREGPSYPGA